MKKLAFIISGIIPSKKNSKKLFKNKATGRNFIVSSDSYREWENKHIYELGEWMQKNGNFLGKKGLHISYIFSTGKNKDGSINKKKWDLSNKIESINDMMVQAGMIDDDNYTIISSFDTKIQEGEELQCEVIISLQ